MSFGERTPNYVCPSSDGCLAYGARRSIKAMVNAHAPRTAIATPVTAAVVFLLALNLRPAVTSLGAALDDMPFARASIAAVLVALPLWTIGVGGWMTPWLCARWGTHRTVTRALGTLVLALVIRVLGGPALLLTGTALACLAIAVIGTVLPVLAHVSPAGYTLALGLGSTAGALITPPIVTTSSWQLGLAIWAMVAVITIQIWRRTGGDPSEVAHAVSPRSLLRSGSAWVLTVYFGLSSTVAFLAMGWLPAILRDAGLSPQVAGSCLALAMATGLPMMWLVPRWVRRWPRHAPLVSTLAACSIVGVTGLLAAPTAAPWIWSVAIGIGLGSIALALTTISLRGNNDPDRTRALSAMVQGIGYLIAGIGALIWGLLH
jgi:CP family cyanate transporter-like MFS transporter